MLVCENETTGASISTSTGTKELSNSRVRFLVNLAIHCSFKRWQNNESNYQHKHAPPKEAASQKRRGLG